MKPVTLSDLARRYFYFLDFLDPSNLLDRGAAAADQVTPGNVAGYLEELKDRVGSVTVYGSIYKLRRASQLLEPRRDLGWLILALVMQPRSKADRFALTEVQSIVGHPSTGPTFPQSQIAAGIGSNAIMTIEKKPIGVGHDRRRS